MGRRKSTPSKIKWINILNAGMVDPGQKGKAWGTAARPTWTCLSKTEYLLTGWETSCGCQPTGRDDFFYSQSNQWPVEQCLWECSVDRLRNWIWFRLYRELKIKVLKICWTWRWFHKIGIFGIFYIIIDTSSLWCYDQVVRSSLLN